MSKEKKPVISGAGQNNITKAAIDYAKAIYAEMETQKIDKIQVTFTFDRGMVVESEYYYEKVSSSSFKQTIDPTV